MSRYGIVLAAALLVFAGAQASADFPEERPIRLVTPYGAGGGLDVAARILSSVAESTVRTRVDVVNMPGAGGLTAASFVLDAEADGYTLLISDYSPLVTLPMREDTPYAADDWVPLVQVTEIAPTFVVHESSGFSSLAELLSASRRQPGELAATHGIYMSSSHLPLLRLEQVAGVSFNHVPTSGGGETFQFLLGRVVSLAVTTPATIVGPARAGRVLPVAVATAERVPELPDTPTLRESGFDIVMPVWYTIFAPAAVADDRAALLADRIGAAYAGNDAQSLAKRAGLAIAPITGDALRLRYAETVEGVAATLDNLAP